MINIADKFKNRVGPEQEVVAEITSIEEVAVEVDPLTLHTRYDVEPQTLALAEVERAQAELHIMSEGWRRQDADIRARLDNMLIDSRRRLIRINMFMSVAGIFLVAANAFAFISNKGIGRWFNLAVVGVWIYLTYKSIVEVIKVRRREK